MNGQTIKLFLADGTPDGLRTAEIINWTGKMIVFPRSQLSNFIGRSEASRTGIYVLIGDDPNDVTREQIYIGESDDVGVRLLEHTRDSSKDFWTRTIVGISKDDNLSKAHVRRLEHRLIALARDARRALITNGNAGTPVKLSESDIADMELFLAQVQVLLPVLGHPFAQPLPTIGLPLSTGTTSTTSSSSPRLVLQLGRFRATGYEAAGTFVVQSGSYAQGTTSQSIGKSYGQQRDALRQRGALIDSDQPGYWMFGEDTAFNSPSAAATVIQGSNINGRTAWRVDGSGQTYKEWQESQLGQTSATVQLDDVDDTDSGTDEESGLPGPVPTSRSVEH